MKKSDVDILLGTMRGGVKTKSGKSRIVPIHSRILKFVEKRYNESDEFFIELNFKPVSKSKYYIFWKNIMKRIDAEHTVHETRHTFRTRLGSAGANKVSLDRLMGHAGSGTGERIYTHKTIEELRAAVELLT